MNLNEFKSAVSFEFRQITCPYTDIILNQEVINIIKFIKVWKNISDSKNEK